MSTPERKKAFREQGHARRKVQMNKDEISRHIVAQFLALPEYSAARTVMFYVDVGAEVRTRTQLAEALAGEKQIVVPYCTGGRLALFHLQHMHELQSGAYRIPEPRSDLRAVPQKHIDIAAVDLIMVPGVAFDRRGARIGVGQGYYDKLLASVRTDATLVGLAFECQVFELIPAARHDIFMDRVITESAVYVGRGRR